MADLNLVSLLMLLAGTGLFMVAGFAVCVALMIFCDIMNLRGSFDTVAEPLIAAIFAPILLAGTLADVIVTPFVREEIKNSLRPPTVATETRTVTV